MRKNGWVMKNIKEMRTLRKNQNEMPEINNTVTEMSYPFKVLIN